MFLVEIMKDSPAFGFGGVRPVLRRKGRVFSPKSVQMRGKMIFFFKMKVADEIRAKKAKHCW